MIMKANKQIGFIYKNNESIDKILKDGDVVFERGFLREKTTTTLPITFGGVGKDLKDYRVYGNTYQNSTSGKNLLDDKNITAKVRCTVDNGVITTTPLSRASTVYVNINDIPLKAGEELYTTFKVRLKSGTAPRLGYGGRLFDGTTYATNTNVTPSTVSDEFVIYSIKQTTTTDIIANQMVFQAANAAGVSDAVYEIKDIIVSTNPIDTYEEYTGGQPSPNPDYPQEIVSCGDLITDATDVNYGKYKIPVNVRSENLLKVIANSSNGITSIINSDGSITYSGTATSTWANITQRFYKDLPSGTYTLSINKVMDYRVAIRLYYEDGTYQPFVIYAGDTSRIITVTQNIKSYYIYISNALTVGQEYNDTLYVQLEEGSTVPTKFQPYYNETTNIYLDEPLRKIDGYSDYIDFINGKVVRNIKEAVFDGSENWVLADIYNNISQFDYSNVLIKKFTTTDNIALFANYFGTTNRWPQSWLKDNIALYRVNNNKIRIQSSNFTTLEDFKTWLSTHNTIVDYVLATPTEETITLPNIPTIDGNNTLNIETEITPSQVYIKYKSNE